MALVGVSVTLVGFSGLLELSLLGGVSVPQLLHCPLFSFEYKVASAIILDDLLDLDCFAGT